MKMSAKNGKGANVARRSSWGCNRPECSPSHVLVADDHPFACEYVAEYCRGKWPAAAIDLASTFDETLALAEDENVDFLITDYVMPGWNGREAIGSILRGRPGLKVIVFSGAIPADDAVYLLKEGLAAYLPKTAGVKALDNVINLVLMGETYAPASAIAGAAGINVQPAHKDIQATLSVRDITLLTEFARGKSNKIIAAALGLSESAIKQAARALFRKLGVGTRAQAVAIALRFDLIAPTHNAGEFAPPAGVMEPARDLPDRRAAPRASERIRKNVQVSS